MMEMNFSSIAKHREMSKFLANELIYEYVNRRLDERRYKEVSKLIEKNADLVQECNNIMAAQNYCKDLGQMVPIEGLVQRLTGAVGLTERIKYLLPARWPIPLKWGIEALVVSCAVAAVTLVVFWSNIESYFPHAPQSTLLVENIRLERETNTPITDKGEIAEFQKNLAANPTEEVSPTEADPQPPTKAPAPAPAEIVQKTVAPTPPPAPAPKKKGYLYKLYMKLDNLDVIGPEIAAKIEEMDGIKAGEVELGWRKPNGSYYHFVIPKSNYDALQEMLKSYGPLTTVKEAHDRVMPEEQERYILWIEGN